MYINTTAEKYQMITLPYWSVSPQNCYTSNIKKSDVDSFKYILWGVLYTLNTTFL